MKLSILIGQVLLWAGLADPQCLCGHKHSEHDFTPPTESGFCQSGHYDTGCSCMKYEVKGSRPTQDRRGDPSTWK